MGLIPDTLPHLISRVQGLREKKSSANSLLHSNILATRWLNDKDNDNIEFHILTIYITVSYTDMRTQSPVIGQVRVADLRYSTCIMYIGHTACRRLTNRICGKKINPLASVIIIYSNIFEPEFVHQKRFSSRTFLSQMIIFRVIHKKVIQSNSQKSIHNAYAGMKIHLFEWNHDRSITSKD